MPGGHGSGSKDRVSIFLEESITLQFFCIICSRPLVLCTEGTQRWNFITPSGLVLKRLQTNLYRVLSPRRRLRRPWLRLSIHKILVIGLPIQPLLLERSQIRARFNTLAFQMNARYSCSAFPPLLELLLRQPSMLTGPSISPRSRRHLARLGSQIRRRLRRSRLRIPLLSLLFSTD